MSEGCIMTKSLILVLGVLGAQSVLPIDARYDVRAMYQYYLRLQACQRSFPEEEEFSKMVFELRRVAKETETYLSEAEIEIEWKNQATIFVQSGMNRLLNGWYGLTVCKLHISEAAQRVWQLRREPLQPVIPKKDF
jgi:hypothetical protein